MAMHAAASWLFYVKFSSASLLRAIGSVRCPSQQKREQRAQGRVGHQREAPEQSVQAPIAPALRFGQFDGRPQNRCAQERRERRVPHPFEGKHHRTGEQGPQPGRSAGHSRSGDSLAGIKNRHAHSRREQSVEEDHGEERGAGENPKYAEDPRHQQRVHRREPSGRSRVFAKRRAKSSSRRERFGNASGFLAKHRRCEHVVRKSAFLVLGKAQTRSERHQKNQPQRSHGLRQNSRHGFWGIAIHIDRRKGNLRVLCQDFTAPAPFLSDFLAKPSRTAG